MFNIISIRQIGRELRFQRRLYKSRGIPVRSKGGMFAKHPHRVHVSIWGRDYEIARSEKHLLDVYDHTIAPSAISHPSGGEIEKKPLIKGAFSVHHCIELVRYKLGDLSLSGDGTQNSPLRIHITPP